MGALYDVPVGEVWPMDKIMALKKQVENVDLSLEVIESVNVHEDIKLGLPTRDQYIENYRQSIRNLAKAGIKVICYNFMPIFDWVRTELAHPLADGSSAMAYDHSMLKDLSPEKLVNTKEPWLWPCPRFSLSWHNIYLLAAESLYFMRIPGSVIMNTCTTIRVVLFDGSDFSAFFN